MRRIALALAALGLTGCSTIADWLGPDKDLAEAANFSKPELSTPKMTKPSPMTDPFLWLEEVEGEEALKWVTKQNDRSLSAIESHPAYAENLEKAMDLATSNERIPYGRIRDGQVYNFWQDEKNTRGLWRRTPLESYKTDAPVWETILDFDALAEAEDANWVFKGADCFKPKGAAKYLCMVSLSDGGKDAVIQREFDLTTKTFVEGGFQTTEAKQGTAWIDHDTMLVATDWGGDGSTLTTSGYPTSVRLLKRGQALEDAVELYAGQPDDVGTWPWASERPDGSMIFGAVEADTFFTRSYWMLDSEEPVQIPVPPKSELGDEFEGYQFVTLQQDWDIGEAQSFKTGDLVAFNLDAFLATKSLPPVELVFRANERQAVNGVAIAKDTALLSINDNVASRVLHLERGAEGWTTSPIALPGTGQASISFADRDNETVFINYEGFLTPDSLLSYDVKSAEMASLKSLPEKFDASGLVVHQKEAVSKDGTKVPYFIIHREDIELNGANPTLLYGYGGFEVSLRPSYSGGNGRMWLEKGGVYVLANIRGGGEFGPAWHQAGLKGNRQRIYDDFIAVGEALADSGITSPQHLGIMGGSNGGLLMGVMMVQRPELWNAVVIQVPLLDMLRYHKLLAGASWIDEYGDPDIPEERAFLEEISPYQNFRPRDYYPTPFFVTSTKDDRVHPGHARKMARLMEEFQHDFFYYENIDGGHSAAANQKERAKRTALEFTYLTERLFPPVEAE